MMPDLLRYQVIAVLQYSFTPDALYLRHHRQLQNLGYSRPFLKIATSSHIPMTAAAKNPIIPIRDIP